MSNLLVHVGFIRTESGILEKVYKSANKFSRRGKSIEDKDEVWKNVWSFCQSYDRCLLLLSEILVNQLVEFHLNFTLAKVISAVGVWFDSYIESGKRNNGLEKVWQRSRILRTKMYMKTSMCPPPPPPRLKGGILEIGQNKLCLVTARQHLPFEFKLYRSWCDCKCSRFWGVKCCKFGLIFLLNILKFNAIIEVSLNFLTHLSCCLFLLWTEKSCCKSSKERNAWHGNAVSQHQSATLSLDLWFIEWGE